MTDERSNRDLREDEVDRLLRECPREESLDAGRREAIWQAVAEEVDWGISAGPDASPTVAAPGEKSPGRKRARVRRIWIGGLAAAAVAAVVLTVVKISGIRESAFPGEPVRSPLAHVEIARGLCLSILGDPENGEEGVPLSEGDALEEGTRLEVGQGGGMRVRMRDGSTVWLCEGTEAVIEDGKEETRAVVRVKRGEIRADVAPSADRVFRVETPGAALRVLGTQFHCRVMPALMREDPNMERLRSALNRVIPTAVLVTVLSGSVAVETQAGEQVVGEGQRTVVTEGKSSPVEPVKELEYSKKWLGEPGREVRPEALVVFPAREYLIQTLWAVDLENGEARHITDFVGGHVDIKQRFGPDLAVVDANSVLFAHFGNEPIGNAGRPFINDQIFLVDILTGEKIPMVPLRYYDPLYMELSPDRRKLAFVGSKKPESEGFSDPSTWTFGIFVLDLETLEVAHVLEGAMKTCPHWSPDSRWLAVSKGEGYTTHHPIVLIDTVTGEVVETGLNGAGVHFTPDGEHLVYTGDFKSGGSWSAGVPSTGNLLLAAIPNGPAEPLTTLPEGGAIFPSFSPDGKWMTWWETHRERGRAAELHLLQMEGRTDQVATEGNAFSSIQWLEGGKQLLLTEAWGKSPGIPPVTIVDVSGDTQSVREITPEMPKLVPEQVRAADAFGDRLYTVFSTYRDAVAAQDLHDVATAQAKYREALGSMKALARDAEKGVSAPESALRIVPDDLAPYVEAIEREAALTPEERCVQVVHDNLKYYVTSLLGMFYEKNQSLPPTAENLAQWAPRASWQINHIRSSDTERVRGLFVVPGDSEAELTSYEFTRVDPGEGVVVLRTPVLPNGKRLEATYRMEKQGERAFFRAEVKEIE